MSISSIFKALRIYIDNAPPSLTTGAFSEIYCSFHFPNQQVVNVTAISREDK
jgi:hypothetical protein